MKQTSFAALPHAERDALLEALRASGIAPHQVCISQLELPPGEEGAGAPLTMVTSPRFTGRFDSASGRMVRLQQDLSEDRAPGDA